MASTPQKFPPPPFLVGTDQNTQMLNRWLLEVQNVLAAAGGVDPSNIAGFTALQTQVATNTTNIATLETGQGGQGTAITLLESDVATLFADVATINGQITTLSSRAQVFNGVGGPGGGLGNVNDWYADTTNKHIYVKTAVGTWTMIV
jgi:hypothetical protein